VTLVVGVLCSDGAVLAADRQATDAAAGMPTIAHSVTKIAKIGSDCLFAFSGGVGLGQQICDITTRCRKDVFEQYPAARSISDFQTALRSLLDKTYATANAAAPVLGAARVGPDVTCTCVLAAPFKGELHLAEITPTATIERKTAELPFVTLGSGKGNADSFLGFLSQTFWQGVQPNVRDATLAAYWTVKHAIEQHTALVGIGIDVFIIEKVAGKYKARQLANSDFAEHDEFIAECRASLLAVRAKFATPPEKGEVAEPPTPN